MIMADTIMFRLNLEHRARWAFWAYALIVAANSNGAPIPKKVASWFFDRAFRVTVERIA
jgi:hypothetical protein